MICASLISLRALYKIYSYEKIYRNQYSGFIAIVVAVLTFAIGLIKIMIGTVFLVIMAIALLALWIMWKVNDDD